VPPPLRGILQKWKLDTPSTTSAIVLFPGPCSKNASLVGAPSLKDTTHSLTIYLIKPGTSQSECLNKLRPATEHGFTLFDGTQGSVFTDSIPPHSPKWVGLLSKVVPNLPALLSSNASAVLFLPRKERLFALTFGYGKGLLIPGSWDEDFGLKVTLNAVDSNRIKTVDRATLDAIGQQSRIQASREAKIGEFGLDLEQDFLRAVTGVPRDETLGKQLTGKDALNVKLPITIEKLPALVDRYMAEAESKAYKEIFPWMDQIHLVISPTKVAELDATMIDRIRAEDSRGLWLSIPEIIDWTEIDSFKYRDSRSARTYPDVHIHEFLNDVGGSKNISLELVKKGRHILAVSQQTGDVFDAWTVYRCLYCEIDQGSETYLLNNGKWYRLGADFRERINEQFTKVPRRDLGLPTFTDKSEADFNARIATSFPNRFALLDRKEIKCGGQYDKVEFCDLFDNEKRLIHVKRYAGASAPLSHMFAQAVVSASLLRRDSDFRQEVVGYLPPEFQGLIREPSADEYEVVLAIVSTSKKDLMIPFFSRVNLNNAWLRLQDLGYKVSLAKIQA
jgi:uncharacterized protein (TIGR04141 family)